MAISLTSEFKDLNLNLWTVILVYAQNCMSFSALEDSSTIKLYTEEKKNVQQRSINHHENNGYKIKVYLQDNLKSFSSQPVLFSWQPRPAHQAPLGARWWNYYIKLRNRRARSFLLRKILATQWKNHLFRRRVLFMSSPGLWGHL